MRQFSLILVIFTFLSVLPSAYAQSSSAAADRAQDAVRSQQMRTNTISSQATNASSVRVNADQSKDLIQRIKDKMESFRSQIQAQLQSQRERSAAKARESKEQIRRNNAKIDEQKQLAESRMRVLKEQAESAKNRQLNNRR